MAGWLNTDIYPSHRSVVHLDATRRFPFQDNSFAYVMAEHMIEHLDYEGAQNMLRECCRVLQPGGSIRIATPDLEVILGLHAKKKTELQKYYLEWAGARFVPDAQNCQDVFVINNFFRAWGHSFLYDGDTLRVALSEAGFHDITFYRPGASDDPSLMGIEAHGKELESEKINEFETMVAEARKATITRESALSVA
jgi:predicted SAM-dependent methyltransferase